jgi:integrase/recombinase XerD
MPQHCAAYLAEPNAYFYSHGVETLVSLMVWGLQQNGQFCCMKGPSTLSEMRLYTPGGQRLYISRDERERLLATLAQESDSTRLLGQVLIWSGCRISEAVALEPRRIDRDAGVLVFESLKKRREGVFRAVPVPVHLLDALTRREIGEDERLFPMHRATAHRHLHDVMSRAGISGPQASAKGLRHGFGVAAIQAGVPLNLVQKWLGHASIRTTAIYANATGAEERTIAAQMWKGL